MLYALLALACTTPPPDAAAPGAAAPTHVRVALNWYPEPEFGGFYAAKAAGLYERAGLDVEILPGGPGAPVLELLAAGRAEVAVAAAEDLLVRRAKGLDAVAILPGLEDSPAGLMTRAGGATTLADVKGRVAIELGSPFERFLSATYNWPGKVEVVPTTGGLGPFAADPALTIQAFITAEPCAAESQGIAVTFLPAREAGWNPYASVATVRGADVDAPWVRAFRDATAAGWNAYLADPAPANALLLAANPQLTPALVDCVVRKQTPFVTGTDGVGAMTAARWNELAAALRSIGQEVKVEGAWKDLGGTTAEPAPAQN